MEKLKKLVDRAWIRTPYPVKRLLKRSGLFRLAHRAMGPNYEPEMYRLIQSLVEPGWVCADVGANIGSISWILAEKAGKEGQVVAFEPHPDNVRRLRENMRDLGYEGRVKVEHLAVSDGSQSSVVLFAGEGRMDVVWNIVGHDIHGNPTEPECEVDAVALDEYFPEKARLNLVKIDVEGAGAQVLAGMRRLLREARPILLIEFHDAPEWEGRADLVAAGYEIFDVDGGRMEMPDTFPGRLHCVARPGA